MKTKLLLILAALAPAFAPAQTANTNDVRSAVTIRFEYSTNQHAALVWYYRQVTNAWPTNLVAPAFQDWARERVVRVEANVVNDYLRQMQDEAAARDDFRALRAKWFDLSEAQRNAILNAAGITP